MQEHPSYCSVFWYLLFYKNLIVLHHGDKITTVFWHFYQIHTFINNLNDKQMATSHLMRTFSWKHFLTEVLILRSSRSQMFFKIHILKDFAIFTRKHLCWPSFTEHPRSLLLDFDVSKYFLKLSLVFIAASHTGFCSELLWKHELNVRSCHWNSSVKEVFLKILQVSQENNCVEVSF